MGCKCNENKPKAYAYVAPDGTETKKATEVEAVAMKIRAGGVGEVKPVTV